MKFAIVNNKKTEAFPAGKGKCICCNNETIAKCGKKKIHHWAHKNLKHCDTWWDNETEWHRTWKNHFPKEWQEIVHTDKKTGEKHIADVKTSKGFVLEFQNSPISLDELKSREIFYDKMLWIVNGIKFQTRFHILEMLPNPHERQFQDIAFFPAKKKNKGRLFYRYSENPDYKTSNSRIVHGLFEIEEEIKKHYIGHHLFDWVNPRSVWFEAKKNIFIDFGEEFIWKILQYDKRGLMCVRKINKNHFIKRALG